MKNVKEWTAGEILAFLEENDAKLELSVKERLQDLFDQKMREPRMVGEFIEDRIENPAMV